MILAIETATNICSVAYQNESGEFFEKRVEARGSHSEKLFLFIKALMEEHQFSIGDLSAVLVSEGPGSYTGLRIAASGVKGLLFDVNVPLYSVQTMASFTCSALAEESQISTIHSIIDARRVHVYHQQFGVKDGVISTDDTVEVIPIKSFEAMIQPGDVLIGTGIERLDAGLLSKVNTFGKKSVSARSLIKLYHRREASNFMQKVSPGQFDPKYYTSNQV